MISVNIRELTHNFSRYLKEVKSGERIVILERDTPVADIIPHSEHIAKPGWQREIDKIKIKGESFSKTVVKNRRDEKQ